MIDTGFDVDHADLADGITDESGYFDAAGDFQQTLRGFPDNDHGTFCAGMACARRDNGTDGCGSAPEAELTVIASRPDQVGTQTTLARAVAYAADPTMEVDDARRAAGADVIVSSLGPNGATWSLTATLERAIEFASRRGRKGLGTPLLWASSNGRNVDIAQDEVVSHPNVIAVGRSRNTDREDNSARGEELDFLAPGVNVTSTASGGGTRVDSGTSFAAPLASGVAALMLSINPKLRTEEVRKILRRTCDKIGGVDYDDQSHNLDYGYGRVNAYRAVIEALQPIADHGRRNTDQDGDGRSEIEVTSPWGLGTLDFTSGTLTSAALEPNGSRFDGWLLDTETNDFLLHADLAGQRAAETFVSSGWGVGVLRLDEGSYSAAMLEPNGTRFGGWLLNTDDTLFQVA